LINAIQSNSECEINSLAKHKSDSDLCSNKTTIHKSATTSTTTTTTTSNNDETSSNYVNESNNHQSKHATNLLGSNSKSENLTQLYLNDYKIDADFASILLDKKMKKEKEFQEEKKQNEKSGQVGLEQGESSKEKENNDIVKKKVVFSYGEESVESQDLNTNLKLNLSSHSLPPSDNLTKTPKNESNLSLNK